MKPAVMIGLGSAIFFGGLLAVQGYRSRMPTFDLIPHLVDARALTAKGEIPKRGCLSSYGAYIPPGVTWLLAPGAWLYKDSRLAVYPATLLLFAAGSVGIFFVGRECFGASTGLWAAAAYCVSDRGLFFASNLWPRGHPTFIIGLALAVILWVNRRDGRWLAAGLFSWAVGLYVFMETLPAVLAVGLVWLRFRPPIHLQSLLLAGAAATLLWSPYLLDQKQRGFVDLRALLTRRAVELPDVTPFFCDPHARVVAADGSQRWPEPKRATTQPALVQAPAETPLPLRMGRAFWSGLYDNAGPSSVAAGLLITLVVLSLASADFFPSNSTARTARQVLSRLLFIPWLLLVLMAESEPELAGRRMWWLWPMQLIAAMGAVSLLLSQRPRIRAFASMALTAGLLWIGQGSARLADWSKWGFQGRDAEQWTILERISQNKKEVDVSYQIHLWAHMFRFHVLDNRYKIGWEWDAVLEGDFGTRNRVRCPEGVDSTSTFTVVERNIEASFAHDLGLSADLIYRGDHFELWRRRPALAEQNPR